MRRRSAAIAALLVLACTGAKGGPQPIAWDREPCGSCRMLISEPGFAAQVIQADGRALSFDDPGCLLSWLGAGGEAREIWLHHVREERWLRAPAVAFIKVARSPMGHNLGAVDPGTPGATSWDAHRPGRTP